MFLDTSGLFSFLDTADANHDDAVRLLKQASSRLTHSYVLAELIALSHARRLERSIALRFATSIMDDSGFEVVWVSESLHREGIALLHARPDKTYSLCDAVSFSLMRQRKITEALTADHHFEQEGFVLLLKD